MRVNNGDNETQNTQYIINHKVIIITWLYSNRRILGELVMALKSQDHQIVVIKNET